MWWLGGRFVSATWDTAELIARGDTSIQGRIYNSEATKECSVSPRFMPLFIRDSYVEIVHSK